MNEQQARKRVKEIKEFYGHAFSFLLVNAMLMAVNLWTSPEHLWFLYPLFGWGIGLASHGASVFGMPGLGRDWEERKVRELTDDQVTREEVERLVQESRIQERLPAGGDEAADMARLIRRLEHLETIVTSRDWELLEARELDTGSEEEEEAERTARLARQVR